VVLGWRHIAVPQIPATHPANPGRYAAIRSGIIGSRQLRAFQVLKSQVINLTPPDKRACKNTPAHLFENRLFNAYFCKENIYFITVS
jgi:hypothetical protein